MKKRDKIKRWRVTRKTKRGTKFWLKLVRLAVPSDRRTFQSPWSWVCVAGRCERRAVRSSRTSLASCIALCGGNSRLLWPRPTGNVLLGEESVVVHLQQIEFVTVNTSDQETRNLLEHAKDVFIGDVS